MADIMEAKKLIVKAGLRLLETGLIARTWGNVSCRVSDTHFAITPSGRAYNTLTPDDIVLVKIDDLSYEGDIKPSSEKGVHAEVYKHRPDINFVIHTHQLNASMISVLRSDINFVPEKSAAIIGDHIPVSSYGLPSTKKLRDGVTETLKRSDSKAILLANHGAVCMGVDYEDAFKVAEELEKVCEDYVRRRFSLVTGKIAETFESLNEYIAEKSALSAEKAKEIRPYNSEREGEFIKLSPVNGGDIIRVNTVTEKAVAPNSDYPPEIYLHLAVFNKRKDVNAIVHSKKPEILAVSKCCKVLKPFLDDFAQIAGISARSAEFDPNDALKTSKKVVKKLKGRNSVLLKDNGMLCVAGNNSDAQAVEMVAEKNAKAYIASKLFGKNNVIAPHEALLMRFIYKAKYSKKAQEGSNGK
jgi:L-fuculose-phosphate aldolase